MPVKGWIDSTLPLSDFTSARSFNRLNTRNNEDLPPPAGPNNTDISFALMLKLMSLNDSLSSEYFRYRCSTDILIMLYLPLPMRTCP